MKIKLQLNINSFAILVFKFLSFYVHKPKQALKMSVPSTMITKEFVICAGIQIHKTQKLEYFPGWEWSGY